MGMGPNMNTHEEGGEEIRPLDANERAKFLNFVIPQRRRAVIIERETAIAPVFSPLSSPSLSLSRTVIDLEVIWLRRTEGRKEPKGGGGGETRAHATEDDDDDRDRRRSRLPILPAVSPFLSRVSTMLAHRSFRKYKSGRDDDGEQTKRAVSE